MQNTVICCDGAGNEIESIFRRTADSPLIRHDEWLGAGYKDALL